MLHVEKCEADLQKMKVRINPYQNSPSSAKLSSLAFSSGSTLSHSLELKVIMSKDFNPFSH